MSNSIGMLHKSGGMHVQAHVTHAIQSKQAKPNGQPSSINMTAALDEQGQHATNFPKLHA